MQRKRRALLRVRIFLSIALFTVFGSVTRKPIKTTFGCHGCHDGCCAPAYPHSIWLARVSTVIEDVRTNCFCASRLRTQIHVAMAPRHSSSARKENLQAKLSFWHLPCLAKTTTSPGFCSLKRSVTPIFFWTHRLLWQISADCQKMHKKSMLEVSSFFSLSIPPRDRIPRNLKLCEFGNAII